MPYRPLVVDMVAGQAHQSDTQLAQHCACSLWRTTANAAKRLHAATRSMPGMGRKCQLDAGRNSRWPGLAAGWATRNWLTDSERQLQMWTDNRAKRGPTSGIGCCSRSGPQSERLSPVCSRPVWRVEIVGRAMNRRLRPATSWRSGGICFAARTAVASLRSSPPSWRHQ